MRKIRVYIASPYTKGDVAVNVRIQMDAANDLMDAGFVPYTPLLTHFQHIVHPRPYQDWLDLDLEWIRQCDCLLRLPGESLGASQEEALAESLEMPIFHSVEELKSYFQ